MTELGSGYKESNAQEDHTEGSVMEPGISGLVLSRLTRPQRWCHYMQNRRQMGALHTNKQGIL